MKVKSFQRNKTGRFMSTSYINEFDKRKKILEVARCSKTTANSALTDHNYVKPNVEDPNPVREHGAHCFTGRRIVNLAYISNQLKVGCRCCKESLHLYNVTHECRRGLASILTVQCHTCGTANTVYTDTKHRTSGNSISKKSVYDVNTKAAIGMLHAGIGHAALAKILAAFNIPSLTAKTLKYREREVGTVIESIAKDSCKSALVKETDTDTHDGPTAEIAASFDGAWQKRGSGHAYNSLSGHATMIGKKCGKIVAYDVRCKDCRFCKAAELNNRQPAPHDCRKNWHGSSKAMEPSMCVSMLNSIKGENVRINQLIMDDDSTSIARARTECDPAIQKSCDSNHLKKSLTSKLYMLSKSHKSLTSPVIKHISKCFMYAITQCKENSDDISARLTSIVPHLYGDHSICDVAWCGYLQCPEKYCPSHLPYKRYLQDINLRKDLDKIMLSYSANSKKLCHIGSSQRNECFNRKAVSKNPKHFHYSGSESTCFRIASAVAETNIGHSYLCEVNEKLLLSPGGHTKKITEQFDRNQQKQAARNKTVKYKKRRLEKKECSKNETSAKEIREGTTYQSGVEQGVVLDENLFEIPPIQHEPQKQIVQTTDFQEIYFDLETTSLGLGHIVQIAASTNDTAFFNRYVRTSRPMSLEAAKVTGIATANDKVYRNGQEVASAPIQEVFHEFVEWVSSFDKPAVLIAHNAMFDAKVFVNTCININMYEQMAAVIVGFVDTLKLFKVKFPQRKCNKQDVLVKDILHLTYNAHDALEDCVFLRKLLCKVLEEASGSIDILEFSFSFKYTECKLQYEAMKHTNVSSLHTLVQQKILTKFMAEKVGGSGLSLNHLQLAYNRDTINGIKFLFTEKCGTKCRVTKCKDIIKKCQAYFECTN